MSVLWMLPIMGLALIGLGIWQSIAPLDILWQQKERYLLARGFSPLRSELWEQNVRRAGAALGVVGVIILALGIGMAASVPPKMSGVSVNGHGLTQKQWDDCHHNEAACLAAYTNGQMR